ncbi:MAG: Ig-like domain repeat protein, partial [Actinobacteria bacterium]|nr:Ig-like domain repeat protein [Actinomycetota bacterium]
PLILSPPGGTSGSDRCTISFSINVLRMPTIDSDPPIPGTQTTANLRVKETGNVSGLVPTVVVSQEITVVKANPGLSTQASGSVPVGASISDTATLTRPASAPAPTGTVMFSVYGPNNATCSGAPFAQSTNAVTPQGTAVSSAFPVAAAGTYRFTASYSGDINYNPVSSPCNAAFESVTVTGGTTHRAPADFNGDGVTDVSVFRPSTGQWLVRGISDTIYGASGDIPVPGNYNADNTTDIALYRPSTGQWLVKGISDTVYGAPTDIPVPGDYNGDGITDIAVYRPSTGQWLVKGISDTIYGASGDIPVPGYYNADNTTDIAVYRPSTGQWLVKGISDTVYG